MSQKEKIRFMIDNDNKVLKIGIEKASLERIAKNCVKENISSKKASEKIAYFVSEIMNTVFEEVGLDIKEYKPEIEMVE